MRGVRRVALLLAAVAASGCRSHDAAAELRVSDRETQHLRVLIANERKDRLALVARSSPRSGTR